MRRCIAFLAFLSLCLALAGCARQSVESGDGEFEIVTTLFPAYDFARQIAGDRARVSLLVPPGSESHSYEPTPRDIERIEGCGLLFCNGGASEAWLEQLLADREQVPVLAMLSCVKALEEETVEGMQEVYEEEEEGPAYDEHVWTSPANALLICRSLCERLCALDPAGAETYRANLAAYEPRLSALDEGFRRAVENGRRKTVLFADRFPVRYFTEAYGLDYYAAFPGCVDDAEPSARTVAFLIDKVRQEGIPAVFTIEFSNEKIADVICEDTGCQKLRFHSCHNVSRAELDAGVSYVQLMEENLKNLEVALD